MVGTGPVGSPRCVVIDEMATLIGDLLAGSVTELFEALEDVNWDKVRADVESLIAALTSGDLGKVVENFTAENKSYKQIFIFIKMAIDTGKVLKLDLHVLLCNT